jgi:hypothetical protein
MLKITRGDDKSIAITFPTGTDLTGCTVFFTVKAKTDLNTVDAADNSAVVKAQTSSHSDPLNGRTVITLTHAATASAAPGDYVYDIQLKDSAGHITTYGNGPKPCRILADVGQRTS